MFVATVYSFIATLPLFLFGFMTATDSPPCDNYELVPCGDPKGIFQWEFCTVTVASQRITEVHLDIRYINRRCRKLNFGITTNHQRFWVHQWCFGTFLVCFVPEEAFVKQTGTVAEINNNSDDNKKKEPHDDAYKGSIGSTSVRQNSTTASPTTLRDSTLNVSNTRTTANAFVSIETNSTAVLPTQISVLISTNVSINLHKDTDSNWLQHPDRQSLPYITEKVWIMAAICVSAGVLLALIGLIVCLIIHGNRGEHTKHDRRLSQHDTSTAQLVASDSGTSNDKSVYDFIPVDPETGFPFLSSDEMPNTNVTEEHEKQEIKEHDTKLNIYSRTSQDNDNTYDVLKTNSKPYRSQSETSNYSHLGELGYSPVTPSASEENITRKDITKHVYAILVPCDTGNVQILEQDTSCVQF